MKFRPLNNLTEVNTGLMLNVYVSWRRIIVLCILQDSFLLHHSHNCQQKFQHCIMRERRWTEQSIPENMINGPVSTLYTTLKKKKKKETGRKEGHV